MARRSEYELLLNLKAALGSNFQSTFSRANSEIRQTQGVMQDIKRAIKDAERQEADLLRAMKDTADTVGENTETYRRLQAQLADVRGEKDRLEQTIDNVRQSQEELAGL